MSDVENDLRTRVDDFVSELSALIRRQAIEAVEEVLRQEGGGGGAAAGGGGGGGAARRPGRPPKSAPTPKAQPAGRGGQKGGGGGGAQARPTAAQKRKAGEKRTPAELTRITDQVFNYIKSNPNQGVEQIAKALQTPTKELTLPIKKLLNDKKITSKGQKRATRYSPRS